MISIPSLLRGRPKLRASRYNLVTACPDGGHLLFNQMSGMLLKLSDEMLGQYRLAEEGQVGLLDGQFLKALREGKYLIPETHDEIEFIRKSWDEKVNSSRRKILTVVTTDRCNLGCVYCFEAKSEWRNMDEKVQEELKVFTRKYLTATKTDSFGVTWFGGESTLNMKGIENLSKFFMSICEELGIPFSCYMITNGTTLNEKVIGRLEACGLRTLQITVDGIKEDHDAKRPYLIDMTPDQMNPAQVEQRKKIDKNFGLVVLGSEPPRRAARSSFDDIMANVRLLHKKGFEVSLRINVDHENKANVRTFLEQVDADGLLDRSPAGGVIRAYTHPVFDGCSGCPSKGMTKQEHSLFDIEVGRWTRDKTPDAFRKSMRFSGDTCTANMNYQFVINPDGGISKCWHDATDPTKTVGHISDLTLAEKGTNHVDRYSFNPLDDPECSTCEVLPLCMGGCKANNQFQEKGYNGVKEMGCHATRFALREEVGELYRYSLQEQAAGV
jgi:uncharacterized protein